MNHESHLMNILYCQTNFHELSNLNEKLYRNVFWFMLIVNILYDDLVVKCVKLRQILSRHNNKYYIYNFSEHLALNIQLYIDQQCICSMVLHKNERRNYGSYPKVTL